ncbi:Ivy family c-type lysozyme inhibitor [Serratia nevei]|uniref:Ivy family c-type lysozyme inhibitor n=1 Tax=Serratia nevei TaxID=2703794 RepID=UPI00313E38AB
MKIRYASGIAKGGWPALFLVMLASNGYAADTITTAIQAMRCQPAGIENGFNGTCPYPTDLYKSDPLYKKDMTASLKEAGLAGLLGENATLTGPESPLEPITIAGETWLLGSVCETNNCGDHYLTFLYQPAEHRVTGYYFDGKGHWIGKPSPDEMKVLRGSEAAEPGTPPATVPSPDTPPPNTIWAFPGEGGKTLWQACGGQTSSCAIIANTKYYVAVLNHQSARGCAFGDFYIVARDTATWQQYETGTCSPDAWIRKGTISHGQYLSVDIGVNNTRVQQYPIGYWSMKKEFAGKNRPSWDKAKINAPKSQQ